jgi:hypothetical protein
MASPDVAGPCSALDVADAAVANFHSYPDCAYQGNDNYMCECLIKGWQCCPTCSKRVTKCKWFKRKRDGRRDRWNADRYLALSPLPESALSGADRAAALKIIQLTDCLVNGFWPVSVLWKLVNILGTQRAMY